MHDIEPFYGWREHYIAAEDRQSPFYGKVYNEFTFTNKVYNYFIHPQWDDIGTESMFVKVLFVDYIEQFCIIELIGEWNDCLHNDIMFLKRNVIDKLVDLEIYKYVLCCDHVLNFHSSDESYYEEWYDDIKEEGGWICCIDTLQHVKVEFESQNIQYYMNFGEQYDDINWRKIKPKNIIIEIERRLNSQTRALH